MSYSNNALEFSFENLSNTLISFDKDRNEIMYSLEYISRESVNRIKNIYCSYFNALNTPEMIKSISSNCLSSGVSEQDIDLFIDKYSHLDKDATDHNDRFINNFLQQEKVYFDTILKDIDPNITLDNEQRKAILVDDAHCLLVAGAGAGKTTTMAAKVKYLIEKKNVNPNEIIVISYTNKAIDELKERINKKLKIDARICTFHAFAYDIIKKFSDTPPEINYTSYNIIFDMLAKQIFNNKPLMKKLVYFLGFYFDLDEEIFKYKSLEEYHKIKSEMVYESIKSSLGEYIRKIGSSRARKQKTITGEYLRSAQEAQIANFLYLNGIEYEYEKSYDYPIEASKKQYTPDFYITQGENTAYIEHYGLIGQNFQSYSYSDEEVGRYKKAIFDKRAIHKRNSTTLIETWCYYTDRRSLIEHLEEKLINNGFVLKPRDTEEVYRKIADTGRDKYIYKLVLFMMTFIEQYKTSGYNQYGFKMLRDKTDNIRSNLFLDIAENVYEYYQDTLRKNNQIDFADMINDANEYLLEIKQQNIELPYKYIIIDEFQDIARQRFNFTKRLAEITKAKVVAVGDDWQSIYAFAGSDITLFTRFMELMGSGTELQITHTYRNSQEPIDIAGNFIQKNSEQIKKQLISPKHLQDPIVIGTYDDSYKSHYALSYKVQDLIGRILAEFGDKKSILIIGRYNFDLYNLTRSQLFRELPGKRILCEKYPYAKLHFMTAHSSKGLGYDNVILINMQESKYGFPSQVEDDPIMNLVRYEDKSIPFAEERRLFYVALTRTKNRVYIAAPQSRPSRFLVELMDDYNIVPDKPLNLSIDSKYKVICPKCGSPMKYEFNSKIGISLYLCTNEPEICDFMTNNKIVKREIKKCPCCVTGYLIIKQNRRDNSYFYGCTNYNSDDEPCRFTMGI